MANRFKIDPADIKDIIQSIGYCVASDKITVEGSSVGFMYREEPESPDDSGWRFLSGDETEEYVEDMNNSMIFDVNTIANYDRAIVSYLSMPIGSELERVEGSDEFSAL
ncbi:MAG: DUF2185 domain-containing protein [Bacteroidetes bacterium]|nr:MAG: DUF2185 domain-containing protein [Bacteroidota bacterium]